ncbi:MAG: hypothetical protein JJU34_02450 [Lunatimonas sp.]|uniref:hypothetical protein n=1 Tax=Lunatimonas sp. TaxID=2060141 RepID=UPI00263A6894|nr:hypothetical protein [Lunatimonas sp.]MCC5936120.1 hypothetical protein [Lunatimonas sp.]
MVKNRVFHFLVSVAFALCSTQMYAQGDSFIQTISAKYSVQDKRLLPNFSKTVIDYDDQVFVLSDQGVYFLFEGQLIPDNRYSSLAGKTPLDLTIQEDTGYLYYLYEDRFLSNARAGKPFGRLPERTYSRFAVNADGNVLLTGSGKAALFQDGRLVELGKVSGQVQEVYVHRGVFFVQAGDKVFRVNGNNQLEEILAVKGLQALAFRGAEVIAGTSTGYAVFSLSNRTQLVPWQENLPVPDVKYLSVSSEMVWAGTDQGAFRRLPDGNFRYYASKRWLMEDEVMDMAFDSKGDAYLLTKSGINHLIFKEMTLAEKADHFESKIRQRHIRFGFSTETRVKDPENLGKSVLVDDDNDGLWTSFYLGSMAFKYAVTQDSKAQRYAWESFEAFERLLSINQLQGFPSRTFERAGFKVSGPTKWRESPDEGWEWKGHTSSDEFVGYIFVAAVMDQFVAKTETERTRVAAFIDEILMHMIDNNYYFVDIDGKPTLWGRWNPEYINSYPETVVDRKLGSTTLIAGLQLGYALTGKELYRTEAYRLMEEEGYLENINIDLSRIRSTPDVYFEGHNMGDGGWNHSDDEMAFLTYWVLYHYAFNEELQKDWEWVIENHWRIELPERNALWSLITYGTQGAIDRPSVFWHLEGFPWQLVRHQVKNSHRKDLNFLEENFRGQTTDVLLHADERSIERHNANPFDLDSGRGGATELTGDEFLLPYWMGRYLDVIP